MAYSLTWLSQVLRDAGLKVSECDGWQSRGRAEMGKVLGVLCHYTGGSRQGNMPTLDILIKGRTGADALPGPLSQLGLARDGTYYIIAAGKCNHAGPGTWKGVTSGNTHFIGIEAENTGGANDSPWPEVQMDAYRRGVAAILQYIKQPDVSWCVGHKEYAPTRKVDPNFDMDVFRAAVKAIMEGTAFGAVAPSAQTEPAIALKPTLRRGENNDPNLVKIVQAKVGVAADGLFGPATEAAILKFQADNGLDADGIVGAATWGVV